MIRLYGSPITRAQRVMWMLEELELDYEQLGAGVPTLLGELVPREEIERLNPSGKVPVLVDGDLVLTESFGINLYLAQRYASDLTPRTPEEWAKAFQWTTWVATEVERDLGISIGLRRSGLISKAPDRLREHEAFAQWGCRMALRTLESGLASDAWLVGGRFTVADLNIASLLALAPPAGIAFDELPRVNEWLAECLARPAARSAWGKVLADAHALGFIGDLDVPDQA
jgi:glutathione S-transferase